MADPCHVHDEVLVHMLKKVFGTNSSTWNDALDLSRGGTCNETGTSGDIANKDHQPIGEYDSLSPQYGKMLYAYLSPVIIVVGLIGNAISLKVFRRKSLRRLSGSLYLSAISVSDSLVLLTYVLLGWFDKGLPQWPSGHRLPLIHVHGVCQSFVFFSYVFRFVSVWLIVVFTVERYIAACRPLKRRLICTKTFGRRAILVVCLLAVGMSLFKPILTGIYDASQALSGLENKNSVIIIDEELRDFTSDFASKVCTRNPDHVRLNLALELLYGLLITAIPFITIAIFNLLIINSLLRRNTVLKRLKMVHAECRIRWEFTVTLLAVSTCFVCLNLPYFGIWSNQFLRSISLTRGQDPLQTLVTAHSRRNTLFITKTVYYMNYCVNFFLYLMTGQFYRGEFKAMCSGKDSRKGRQSSTYTMYSQANSLVAFNAHDNLRSGTHVLKEDEKNVTLSTQV